MAVFSEAVVRNRHYRRERAVEALLEAGAALMRAEDRHGDTRTGWWLDGIWLGPRNEPEAALEALGVTATDRRPKLLAIKDDAERPVVERETERGVFIAGLGLVPWSAVDGFWVWHAPTGQYLFIPASGYDR